MSSDPAATLDTILTSVVKGRGMSGIGRPLSARVSDLVKEMMEYWANIDAPASFEWVREDIANYAPEDILTLLDDIRDVWRCEMLEYVRKHYTPFISNSVPCNVSGQVELAIQEAKP